jgi:hypothetical protein
VGGITATGTPSSTTYLRGDSTWATISTSPTAITNGTSNVTVNSSGGTITAATAGTTAVTINTSQQVGIGTASPNEKLVVNGAIRSTNNAASATATPDSGVFFYVPTADAPSDPRTILAGVGTSGVGASIAFQTGTSASNSERMRIDSSGNVGINQTSPTVISTAKQLAIKAPVNGDALFVAQNSNSLTTFIAGYYGVTAGFDRPVVGSYSNDPVAFITNNTERMRIDTSGNLLVGGTAQTNTAKVECFFSGSTNAGYVANDTASASGTNYFIASNNGTNIGSIQRVGATSAIVFNTTSDQRLKSNITDSNSVLSTLMKIKVRQYDWTEGNLHQDYGFIAQELEPLLSGVVTKGKTEEDVWQLDYSRLTPHLVKAIQELKEINDTQAETLTQQTEAINALTARVVALEAK